MLSSAVRTGVLIVALAFLGDDLFLPSLGAVADHFGIADALAPSYGLFPYYGFALAGFLHAAVAGRLPLGAIVAAGLIGGSAANLVGLLWGDWTIALILRFVSGLGFGIAVGGSVIGVSRIAQGPELSKGISIVYSGSGLALAPAVAVTPMLEEMVGLTTLAVAHLGAASLAGLMLLRHPALSTPSRDAAAMAGPIVKGVGRLRALPRRVLHSPTKALALLISGLGLTLSYLLISTLQPALAGAGVEPRMIGFFFTAAMLSGLASGFIHSALVDRFGVEVSRHVIVAWDCLLAVIAGACFWFASPVIGVSILLGRSLLGGNGAFEAMLIDLGPSEDSVLAFQRAALQIIAAGLITIFVAVSAFAVDGQKDGVAAWLLAAMVVLSILRAAAWRQLRRQTLQLS